MLNCKTNNSQTHADDVIALAVDEDLRTVYRYIAPLI